MILSFYVFHFNCFFFFPNETMHYLYVIVVVDDGDDADDETSLFSETKHSYSRKM